SAAPSETLDEQRADEFAVASSPAYGECRLAAPAELLAALVQERQPAAVLTTAGAEDREVAARAAIKTGSGILTDAVDVAADGSVSQQVFAAAYDVTSKVAQGTPFIVVKPNSTSPEPAAAAGTVEAVSFAPTDAAKTARIVKVEEKAASGRPNLTEAAIVVSGGRGTGGDFAAVEAL